MTKLNDFYIANKQKYVRLLTKTIEQYAVFVQDSQYKFQNKPCGQMHFEINNQDFKKTGKVVLVFRY